MSKLDLNQEDRHNIRSFGKAVFNTKAIERTNLIFGLTAVSFVWNLDRLTNFYFGYRRDQILLICQRLCGNLTNIRTDLAKLVSCLVLDIDK